VDEVNRAARNRRIAEAREERIADEAREAARRRTHPEEFEPINPDDLTKLAEKMGGRFKFEKPKPTPPASVTHCPYCSTLLPIAHNLRFMTPDEIRTFAGVVEEIQKQAEMNREANKAHQAKCIAEQLANLPDTPVPSVGDFDEVQL
jgi:hypothetical protein